VLNPNSEFPDCFWGWDELTIYDYPAWIVADDWLCTDDRPITEIHWWGSYWNWSEQTPRSGGPVSFHIGIWKDVPASANVAWSHPGEMIWEWVVARADVKERWVGCDYHPDHGTESCFRYEFTIPESEWFYQEPGPTIYWISISGIYDFANNLPEIWGWKTRKHFFNDDAVRIIVPYDPTVGSVFSDGEPIVDNAGDSWDMAFALFTTGGPVTPTPTSTPTEEPTDTPTVAMTPTVTPTHDPGLKWSQPPVFNPNSNEPDCFWGWDETSAYGGIKYSIVNCDVNCVTFEWTLPVVADDWLSEDDRPITDVHWWGSYVGWNEDVPPVNAPNRFHIGIWTDTPANADRHWSHPETMIWEWVVPKTEIDERPAGCDFYPGRGKDSCFRYGFTIPETQWFYPDSIQRFQIYWISIAAIYDST